MKLAVILWDYDGTLVNTYQKNLTITQEIFRKVVPGKELPPILRSIEQYKKANHQAANWQDLYINHLSLTNEQTDVAGKMWSEYQNKSDVPVEIFEGISDVLQQLEHIPHGICSQNCSNNILGYLERHNLNSYFKSIIGQNDVDYSQQKPDPTGFIRCIENMKLTNNDMTFIYIGDHEKDVEFAKNTEQALRNAKKDIKVWSIAACYSGNNQNDWAIQADYCANSVSDILECVKLIEVKKH